MTIDSNALTYLAQALDSSYDPLLDNSPLMPERVALVRIHFYCGESYYVPPTVEKEYKKIRDTIKRQAHERLHQILLLDSWNLNATAIQRRASVLLSYHNDMDDCKIVAECEDMEMQYLLTCDRDLLTRLAPVASLQLIRPSDFWLSLNFQSGTRPAIAPAPSNPLSGLLWWSI